MSFSPLNSPIPVGLYPTLATFLTSFGVMFFAWFFVYEATTSSTKRSFTYEMALSVISSVVLGLGIFFLLLWTGVYV